MGGKVGLHWLGNLIQLSNNQFVCQDGQGTCWDSPEQVGWHALVECPDALFVVNHFDCMDDSAVLWWVGRLVLESSPDHLVRIRCNTGRHLGG